MSASETAILSREELQCRIRELGSWFHNIDLNGVKTAPDHFLGDYPSIKWKSFAHAIPADLTGKSVLDIGCNAGFYSMEMKRRGASRVLGLDSDDTYLAQARFAAQVNGLRIEYRRMSIYEIPQLHERFDVVMFMGVLYHLRHPLLALDMLSLSKGATPATGRTGGFRTGPALRQCFAALALRSSTIRRTKFTSAAASSRGRASHPMDLSDGRKRSDCQSIR
jgi:SAM-dependent methyltransferase